METSDVRVEVFVHLDAVGVELELGGVEQRLLRGEAGDNNPGTSLSFSQSKDKTAWTIYVPEYLNAGPSGTARGDCSFIELTVKGSGDTYRIDFRDYSTAADDGNRFDIIRNYEYRYTVKATPLLFSVTVEKWQFGGKVIIDL